MQLYMLDADTASYVMKGSDAKLLKRLRRTIPAQVCISVITLAELKYGVEVSTKPDRYAEALEVLVKHVSVLDFGVDAASHYASVRADLARKGKMIGANDLFIAAHSRSVGAVLVTNNVDEFDRVAGLRVEKWT